jgi:hypothetical protein
MPSNEQSYQNLLIELQIFPPIQTIALCIDFRNIIFEAQEHYQKRSFRNRYHIGSHLGLLELSVPLQKGKNNQQPIKEVLISYNSLWPTTHWRAIQSSYGKSAYFIYYKDLIEEVLFSQSETLFELNLKSWNIIDKILQQNWNYEFTEKYQIHDVHTILDLRSKIKLNPAERIAMPQYYQVYSGSTGFIPHLSILDLIFHLGPDAYGYLVSLASQMRSQLYLNGKF